MVGAWQERGRENQELRKQRESVTKKKKRKKNIILIGGLIKYHNFALASYYNAQL